MAADKPPKRRGRPPKQKPAPPPEADLQAAAEAGVDAGLEKAGVKPSADEPPKRSGRPRGSRNKKQVTQQIEDALAELLSAPAIPAKMFGDEWAAQHFTTASREFAAQIARTSERHTGLRRICERALEGEASAMLGFAALAYLVPPLIHYNIIPPFGPAALSGIPRVKRRTPPPPPSPADATEGLHTDSEPRPQVNFQEDGPPVYSEA